MTNRQTFLEILDVFEELKAAKIQEVIDMIDDIGEVKYPDSKDKVMAAYNAFYSIPADDQYLITNEAKISPKSPYLVAKSKFVILSGITFLRI